MKTLIHWLIITLAVLATPYVINGVHVDSLLTAVVVGAVLGFINMIIKPVISVLTLPINILTLGLFSLIINGLFFWFVAHIISGFHVATFTAAFWGALIVSVLNWIGSKVLTQD
jgi:putative membrane protein